MFARPGGELKPTEDHLEGLKRLLNDVSCFTESQCVDCSLKQLL